MNDDKLQQLRIASERKQRSSGPIWFIVGGVLAVTIVVAFLAIPRASDINLAGMTTSREK